MMQQAPDDNHHNANEDKNRANSNFGNIDMASTASTAAAAAAATEMERKLQLLECRFTMPLPQNVDNTTANNSNGNSPATLDPETSSPAIARANHYADFSLSNLSHPNNATTTNSQHSFGFFDTTPSLLSLSRHSETSKRVSTSPMQSAMKEEGVSASAAAAGSDFEWQKIAVQHMAKVAALESSQQQQSHLYHAQQAESTESQDRTLLTSHVVMVAPAPAPALQTLNNENNHNDSGNQQHKSLTPQTLPLAQEGNMVPTGINHPYKKPDNKRKSVVPSKRNTHTVKDQHHHGSLLDRCTAATSSSSSVAVALAVPPPPPSSPRNKRARLATIASTTTARPLESVTVTSTSGSAAEIVAAANPSSTTSASGSGSTSSPSPSRLRKNHSNHSNSSPTVKGTSNVNVKKAINHAKISDFFATNKSKAKNNDKVVSAQASNVLSSGSNDAMQLQDRNYNAGGASATAIQEVTLETDGRSTVAQQTSTLGSINDATAGDAAATRPAPKAAVVDSADLERLQRRYHELEQVCHDKDEQLKAVANNRTIQYSALQSALRQREHELETLRESTEEQQAQARAVLEDLVRSEASRKARALREGLAADSLRLGRLVTSSLALPTMTRGPPLLMMQQHHRSSVETWEDGHAAKELLQKRHELAQKRTVLEERLQRALRAQARVFATGECSATKVNESKSADHRGKDESTAEDLVEDSIQTPLDANEAVESARFHLDSLRKEELDLSVEERALLDEKGAHIRALKRVANEDMSRFRVRPKLHDRYVLCSLLGKGGFSEVWRAYDLVEFREVAVKIHELDARWPESKKENYTKHVSREYEIHRNVRHPRIVSLYDVFEIDNNSFATVLESCDGTDLDTLLKLKRYLPERDARVILLQILSGMNYLCHPSADGSRQGIIHYDLKPGNILFDKYGDAKITDFGLSKIVESADPAESMELTSQGAGTYWYLPPECFMVDENVRISNKVDVWSIGVIYYQMLYGKRPFGDGQSQDKILTNGTMLNAHTVVFPEKPELTDACKDFIRACLTYDQKFRPSIAQLCQHSYVLSKQN